MMVSGVVAETIIEPQRSKDRSMSIETTNSINSNSVPIKEVECIDIADDDDDEPVTEMTPPPPKKQKMDSDSNISIPSAAILDNDIADVKPADIVEKKEDIKAESDIAPEEKAVPISDQEKVAKTYEKLLSQVTDHVHKQIEDKKGLQRKLMDVMLAAINREVLSDPMAIKELIVKKMLVLPNTISHPPSQVLQMVMEHDPDNTLNRIITQLYGEQKPKETEQEKAEKARYKKDFAAPIMTKLVAQIGHDLVQEHTYGDIVHARNLPEVPKDIEGYKRVADQLKPVWTSLKEKNLRYKTRQHICRVCRFKTDSLVEYSKHTWILHHDGKRFSCTLCPEFDNSEYRMKRHYLESHAIVPIPKEEMPTRFDCAICDLDFKFKGELAAHLKECKRNFALAKRMLRPSENDQLLINRWLWKQPEIEPSVAPKKPPPPPQKPRVMRNMVGQPPHLTKTNQRPIAVRAPIASSSGVTTIQPALSKLLPLLASLSSNPAALEKIKIDQPEVFKQLQGHFNSIRNNPQALAQLQKIKNAEKPAVSRPPAPQVRKQMGSVKLAMGTGPPMSCEICDIVINGKPKYLEHMQTMHKKLHNKTMMDMQAGPPLACSRCQHRFWCYDGLERHLVMAHGLVTQEYLRKAQTKEDGGRCQLCKKQYAFNMLQHLVQEHKKNLCSAEIRYSCDVCQYSCTNYQDLEKHLADSHPKVPNATHKR